MAYIGTSGISMFINFNGSGTPSIRQSRRISSITDNGTGDYSLNFSFTVVDSSSNVAEDYAAVGSVGDNGNFTGGYNPERIIKFSNYGNGGLRIRCRNSAGGANDETAISCIITGVFN
jgi:hypothetical protein